MEFLMSKKIFNVQGKGNNQNKYKTVNRIIASM